MALIIEICVLMTLIGSMVSIGILSNNNTQTIHRVIPHTNQTPAVNFSPVIGVLAQEISGSLLNHIEASGYTSFIPANYVKNCESGGARVVPIMINMPDEYYRGIFNVINGLVFPGGSVAFYSQHSGYGRAGRILYDLVLKAKQEHNDEIAVLGTCMGFQMLLYLNAGYVNDLVRCDAFNKADPLYLQQGYEQTRLFGNAPRDVMNTLTKNNSTSNFHHYCATPKSFTKHGIDKNLTLVSTSTDRNGLEYISTVEHKQLPIFGTQWHPENNIFNFVYKSIPHSRQDVRVTQYVINTFVDAGRHNSHVYRTEDAVRYPLIYNYHTTYANNHLIYFFK